MKSPTEIGTVIKEKIYTVPTFTNFYGKKINGDNVTIKVYNETISSPNCGVEVISLLSVSSKHLMEKSNLSNEEHLALNYILEAIKILNPKK